MENQTMETPMTENKASATPEIEAELTKKQRKIREHGNEFAVLPTISCMNLKTYLRSRKPSTRPHRKN